MSRKRSNNDSRIALLSKELVENDCVKKYFFYEHKSERWVVVGKSKEYLVFINPPWCNCNNFQRNVTKPGFKCKHIRAIELAKRINKYDTFFITRKEYNNIKDSFLKI